MKPGKKKLPLLGKEYYFFDTLKLLVNCFLVFMLAKIIRNVNFFNNHKFQRIHLWQHDHVITRFPFSLLISDYFFNPILLSAVYNLYVLEKICMFQFCSNKNVLESPVDICVEKTSFHIWHWFLSPPPSPTMYFFFLTIRYFDCLRLRLAPWPKKIKNITNVVFLVSRC